MMQPEKNYNNPKHKRNSTSKKLYISQSHFKVRFDSISTSPQYNVLSTFHALV